MNPRMTRPPASMQVEAPTRAMRWLSWSFEIRKSFICAAGHRLQAPGDILKLIRWAEHARLLKVRVWQHKEKPRPCSSPP